MGKLAVIDQPPHDMQLHLTVLQTFFYVCIPRTCVTARPCQEIGVKTTLMDKVQIHPTGGCNSEAEFSELKFRDITPQSNQHVVVFAEGTVGERRGCARMFL